MTLSHPGRQSATAARDVAPVAALVPAALFALVLAVGAAADPIDPDPWRGAYLGLSFGAAMKGDDRVRLAPFGAHPGDLALSGPQVAAHIGFNRRFGVFVWGLQGDLALGDVGDSVSDGTYTATSRINRTASARLRLGVASGAGLPFLTGGVAAADLDYSVTGGGIAIRQETTRTGYVVGAGYEHALAKGWSARGEYLYSNFGKTRVGDSSAGTWATPDFHTLQFGLSRRF